MEVNKHIDVLGDFLPLEPGLEPDLELDLETFPGEGLLPAFLRPALSSFLSPDGLLPFLVPLALGEPWRSSFLPPFLVDLGDVGLPLVTDFLEVTSGTGEGGASGTGSAGTSGGGSV